MSDIECWGLEPAVEAVVRDWFGAGRLRRRFRRPELDGRRSVRVAHPRHPERQLKIKGAGFLGRPLRPADVYETGPASALFDFDGRMMHDRASSHDNAPLGGASFQQVIVEHEMSRRLADLGVPVVPCLGYGRVREGDATSWFCVFDVDARWRSADPPEATLDEYADSLTALGELIVELAVDHRLMGYCWFVVDDRGERIVKDVHAFRAIDPLNASRLAWALQLVFSLHIPSYSALNTLRNHAAGGEVPGHLADLQARPFHAICPQATADDHEDLRLSVVADHMLAPPVAFDAAAVEAQLWANPIGRAALDLCPAAFARLEG